jgi:hypothetical protein
MRSPFPGMDPYLESPAHWSDFHGHLVPELAEAINQLLPENYVARLGEHVSVVAPVTTPPESQIFYPDVTTTRARHGSGTPGHAGGAATATLTVPEAVTVENVIFADERTESYVRIVRLPDQELVTVLELLSPTNKYGDGRGEYMQKRREFLRQPVNVVELDLIRAGPRIEFSRPLPPGHYYAFVTRASRARFTDVYTWTVRDRMPPIPVPLLPPDGDVVVDLAPAVAEAYARGRYWRLIDYTKPAPPPLFGGPDAEWVAGTARAGAVPS